ncbi:bacterial regulatory s, gntR family protein [Paraburkholderia xenovorans LB400]|uniref:Transcriptional regulator, GntR family n=2 Tax=Paraburkholderia xenovorans TaxID=36873 RepID=Q13YB6_PARXL|nr:transcriptional regulator, GntR family [Paraburkholderia xenovorans LB400]AIP30777.1 bacterial regulatory s, gntR family protein [Paraburkholderia xenovorans LB400]
MLTFFRVHPRLVFMETDHISPTVSLADFRAHTLTGVVQHEIERMILSGELKPGQRLNEKAVADRLSVSRGPVREACRALAELGLVYLIPQRGVFIQRVTRDDAIEVYDLRAGLTALSASLLAPLMTEEMATQLDAYVDEMQEAAQKGDFSRFDPLNLEFHDYIVRSTGNSRLIKLYRGFVKEFHLFRVHGMVQRGALLQSNDEHREIVNALKSRNASLSYETSFSHVSKGKERMLVALDGLVKSGEENAVPPAADQLA